MKQLTQVPSEPQIYMQFRTVTPALAKQWLQHNPVNRTVRQQHVGVLASAMSGGRFLVNGDCIRFDKNGRLLDGQHRLLACIASGIPFNTYVAYNISDEAVPTVDRNLVRSSGDVLRMMHNVKDYNVIGGTIALLLRLREPGAFMSRHFRPTVQDIELAYSENPERFSGVSAVVNKIRHLCNPSVAGACQVLFTKQDPEAAALFFERLASGEELSRTDPIFVLRDRLVRSRARITGGRSQGDVLPLFIKAWIAFRQNTPVNLLTFARRREDFAALWERSQLETI